MTLEINQRSNYEYDVILDGDKIGGLISTSMLKWTYVKHKDTPLYEAEAVKIRDKLKELN